MFSLLDVVLILAVSAQCVLMARLRHPTAKALMLLIPVPVTFGILAADRPLDITNVVGLVLSMGFTLTVLGLYRRLNVRILLAIPLAALAYCAAATWLAPVLPRGEAVFWWGLALAGAIAVGAMLAMPPREELPYRSPLPVWLKALIILLVITGLVLIKKQLQGFLTTFPMLGVVASYETRRSLYTTSRQIPISCAAFAVSFGIIRLLQDRLGLHAALIPGLAAYAILVVLLNRRAASEGSEGTTLPRSEDELG